MPVCCCAISLYRDPCRDDIDLFSLRLSFAHERTWYVGFARVTLLIHTYNSSHTQAMLDK